MGVFEITQFPKQKIVLTVGNHGPRFHIVLAVVLPYDAAKSLDAADKLTKGDFRVVEMRGRLYVEMNQYGKALDQYNKLIEKFSDDYTLHNMRGLCLMEL